MIAAFGRRRAAALAALRAFLAGAAARDFEPVSRREACAFIRGLSPRFPCDRPGRADRRVFLGAGHAASRAMPGHRGPARPARRSEAVRAQVRGRGHPAASSARQSGLPAMARAAETIRRRLRGARNAILSGVSNARSESINAPVRRAKRNACGHPTGSASAPRRCSRAAARAPARNPPFRARPGRPCATSRRRIMLGAAPPPLQETAGQQDSGKITERRSGDFVACRVGMTMNPSDREKDWLRKYPGLRHWTILGQYSSKSAAQKRESLEARRLGCASSPGGDGPEAATWHVYYFQY